MVTTQDQLNRLYQAVLHRTRGAGEGEDVYLGKDSGFVFDDLYASQERATMLQNEANNTAALISQRDEANNALNAERQKDAGLATSLNDSQLALDEAKKKIELDQATIADLNGKLLTAQGQVEELKAAPAPSPTDASATDQTSKISLGGILGLLSLLKGKGNTMNQTSSTLSSFGSSLLSRKLIVSLIGAVVVFGNAYWNWGLTTDQVMTFLTPLLAYVGFEGFADIKSRTKQS